jgi:hypothetical protein
MRGLLSTRGNSPDTIAIGATREHLCRFDAVGADHASVGTSTGLPCDPSACSGWLAIDNSPLTADVVGSGTRIYQTRTDRTVWQWSNTTCGLPPVRCTWIQLDTNADIAEIVPTQGRLYQRRRDRTVWQYTYPRCQAGTCRGWRQIDNNPRTSRLIAGGD